MAGLDALLAISQMPPGVPVAAVTIGSPGARNAALLAARILALQYPEVKVKLQQFVVQQREGVLAKDKKYRR
jgi:phosphoribosylaminoimidazole carboxylase PurE protein